MAQRRVVALAGSGAHASSARGVGSWPHPCPGVRPGPSRDRTAPPRPQRPGVVNIMSTGSNDRSTRPARVRRAPGWHTGARAGRRRRRRRTTRATRSAWTMAHRAPHPALAGVVAGTYCGYVEDAAGAVPPARGRHGAGRGHHQLRRPARPGGDDQLVLRRPAADLVRRRHARGLRRHRAPAATSAACRSTSRPFGAARLLGAAARGGQRVHRRSTTSSAASAGELTDRLASAARLGRAVRAARPGAARPAGRRARRPTLPSRGPGTSSSARTARCP